MDITINLSMPPLPDSSAEVLPNVTSAMAALAEQMQQLWQSYAAGVEMPNGQTIKPRSGEYLRSIQLRRNTPFDYFIFSDSPYAAALEHGTDAYDMHQWLNTSMKVRRAKNGRKYLIIPFRWGTSGAVGFGRNTMNQDEQRIMRQLAPSRVVGMTTRLSGQDGVTPIPQSKYRFGGRLNIRQHGDLFQTKIGRHMNGMVKFQGDRSGNKDTQYLTFRVMSEGSAGWIRRAQPGKFPAQQTSQTMTLVAQRVLERALQADLAMLRASPT